MSLQARKRKACFGAQAELRPCCRGLREWHEGKIKAAREACLHKHRGKSELDLSSDALRLSTFPSGARSGRCLGFRRHGRDVTARGSWEPSAVS